MPKSRAPGSTDVIVDVAAVERPHGTKMEDWQLGGLVSPDGRRAERWFHDPILHWALRQAPSTVENRPRAPYADVPRLTLTVFRELHEFTKAFPLRAGELLTFEGLIFGASIALIKGASYCTVPVGALAACLEIESEVDQIICLVTPGQFRSVGEWYWDFSQTSDEEVRDLFRRAGAFPENEVPAIRDLHGD